MLRALGGCLLPMPDAPQLQASEEATEEEQGSTSESEEPDEESAAEAEVAEPVLSPPLLTARESSAPPAPGTTRPRSDSPACPGRRQRPGHHRGRALGRLHRRGVGRRVARCARAEPKQQQLQQHLWE